MTYWLMLSGRSPGCLDSLPARITTKCFSTIIPSYGSALYRVSPGGSLPDYLFELALYDDNQFTRTCASNDFFQIPRAIKQAAAFDLNALCAVSLISCETVKEAIAERYPEQKQFLNLLPGYETKHQKYRMEQPWGDHILKIAEFNRSNGS